ncbi:unnamed protein product [Meganyctiphanes norvegica]|uniref:Uncharacterized protein n=1 Tax=Meganyctiphanes norvegica TaxID=48144 RepID=A0AAV2PUY2_MEGNR
MRDTSGDNMFITRWMSRMASAMCGWCLPMPKSTNVTHHVIKPGLGVERNPMDLASPVPLYFENDLDVDPDEDELDSMDMVFYDTKVDYIPKNSKTYTTIEKEKNNNNLKSPVIIKTPEGNNIFQPENLNLKMKRAVEKEKYQSTYYEIDNTELNEINTNNLNSLTFSSPTVNRPTHLDLGANVYRPSLTSATSKYPYCYEREVSMDMDEDCHHAIDNREYMVDHRVHDSTMFNMLRTFRCFEGVETPYLGQQFLPMEVRRPPGKIQTTHMDGYAPINQMSAIIY